MFENSQDLLNITKAVSLFAVSAFICWAIYYFARILQQMFKVVKEFRERFNKIDKLIKTIREKIEHSTSYLLLISEGIKKLVDIAKEKGIEIPGGTNKKKK